MRQFSTFLRGKTWLALTAVATVAVLAIGQERDEKDRALPPDRPAESKERLREGAKFEGSGRFEMTGDRIAFYPADRQQSFRVLENLALERVARVLGENRETRQWNVAGVFTEYQGGNNLLLTRAVVRQAEAKETGR